jgi:hypothetical protein
MHLQEHLVLPDLRVVQEHLVYQELLEIHLVFLLLDLLLMVVVVESGESDSLDLEEREEREELRGVQDNQGLLEQEELLVTPD